MGGIGKTELALQYAIAQLQQNHYPTGLCWLRARDQEIATQIVTFAQAHLGLMPPDQLEIEAQVRFCWQQWPEGDALVILDDVTDYTAIEPYLPPSDPRFKLLITTRLQLGSSVQDFPVEELDEDSAIVLLESLVKDGRIHSQLADAKALCKWVGYLPLALELLGRFLARKADWTISRLLEALEDKRLEAKALIAPESGMTSQLGVAAALELSWQELNELEQDLAGLLGILENKTFNWDLIESCFPEKLINDLEDARDEGLISNSLLKRVGENQYKCHQVIQEFFRLKILNNNSSMHLLEAYNKRLIEIAKLSPLSVSNILDFGIVHLKYFDKINSSKDLGIVGEVFRNCLSAWCIGIGSISKFLFPLKEDYSIEKFGISLEWDKMFIPKLDESQIFSGKNIKEPEYEISDREYFYFIIGWYFGDQLQGDILPFPQEAIQKFTSKTSNKSNLINLFNDGWNLFQSTSIQPEIFWFWKWIKKNTIDSLKKLLESRVLPCKSGYLSLEAAWCATEYFIYGKDRYSRQLYFLSLNPISVEELRSKMQLAGNKNVSEQMKYCINQLHIELESKQYCIDGHLHLPDAFTMFYKNSSISSMQSYLTYIFKAAIDGYVELVTTYFSGISSEFLLAPLLPIHVVGQVHSLNSFSYFLMPFKHGEQSIVDFSLPQSVDITATTLYQEAQLFFSRQDYRKHQFFIQTQTNSLFFQHYRGANPITEFVYQWLSKDLAHISWLEGDLKVACHPGGAYWK